MIKFSVKVKSFQNIPELALSFKQTRALGNYGIDLVRKRVQNFHTDAYDAPLPPYSPRPVYVRLGTSGGRLTLKSGRIPITSFSSIRKAGINIIDGRKTRVPFKNIKKSVVRTNKSLRFPNRAAYKQFLGKSGLRDLTETGAMLAAISILSMSGKYAKVVVLGFKNNKQANKAAGNMHHGEWFGLSPSDELKLLRAVNAMLAENLGLPNSFKVADITSYA